MHRIFSGWLFLVVAMLALAGAIWGGLKWRDSSEGPWRYTTAHGEVVIDRARTGQILHWSADGKKFVAAGAITTSPFDLEDANGGHLRFQISNSFEEKIRENRRLTLQGILVGGTHSIPAWIQYDVSADGRQIRVKFSASPAAGAATTIRSWNWSLPLALAFRKRVYFRGENGLDWESRYFYQFMARGDQLMPRPERNEWRWFGLDQLTPKAFRLWKAESEEVSALMMQEGREIPPYVQIFDPEGGLTVEYPALARQAPKSLRVDASDGATALLQVWPAFRGIANADTPGVFHVDHEIVLTASNEAGLLARRSFLNTEFPVGHRPDPQEILSEPEWLHATPLSRTVPQYVTGGYPFARGELRDTQAISVSIAGEKVPCQAQALGYWPDGSIKWALLTFPISPDKAVANCPAPRVSLRTGQFIPITITTTGGSPTAPWTLTAKTTEGGRVEIQNGPFTVQLSHGTQWLSAQYEGRPLITPNSTSRLAYADYLTKVERAFPFSGFLQGGQREEGTLSVDKVTLEETGPLRASVRLEGVAGREVKTRVILRIQLEAGRPEIALTHSAEFLLKDPRQTFLQDLGIDLPLAGWNLNQARLGETPGATSVGATELLQETLFSRTLATQLEQRLPVEGNGGWVEAEHDNLRFIGVVRDFRESAPKAIAIAPDTHSIRFEIWPRNAGLMDVRRYSNYPHLVQGESSSGLDDWVQTYYYSNEPFVGVSRTHQILLGFWPSSASPSPEEAAADFQSPPLLYAGWERYQATGIVLPQPSQTEWPRAWEAWTDFAKFWLYHRSLHQWYGFWDFGDFRHHFRDGYGWILPPLVIADALRDPSKPELLKGKQILDYRPTNDWAYDNGRWGWSNSEGLPNLFLQQEYLRHGNRVVYFAAEAMARFTRDVVIRHDGKWFGAGTRHGVQHWSDGGHEERQTTSTEFRLHYFLSGDVRTRDVVNKLYDRFYSKAPVSIEAEHSGRWGGLLFHQEMSGSRTEAEQLEKYAHAFIAPDGLALRPPLAFPGPVSRGEATNVNGGSMFFHTYGAMHNLLEYQQITGDPLLRDAIIKMADATLRSPEITRIYASGAYGSDTIYFPPVAFAALHAQDPAPYRKFLETWVKNGAWKSLYQTVSHNPAHWSGDTAFLLGNMPGCFFWTNWAPYITKALGSDTIWNPKIEAEFNRIEKDGKPSPTPPLSWQTEFDNQPNLSGYLDSQKPWNSK